MAVTRISQSSLKQGLKKNKNFVAGIPPVLGRYYALASETVGAGGASSIDFTNVPSGYRHLQIRYVLRTNRASESADRIQIRFNGDVSNNYYLGHRLYAFASGTSSDSLGTSSSIATFLASGSTATANVFGASIIDILDYSSTSKNKVIRVFGGVDSNTVDGQVYITSGMWFPTTPAAITSIGIFPNTGTQFNQYSTISLYGVK